MGARRFPHTEPPAGHQAGNSKQTCFRLQPVQYILMPATVAIPIPETLLLHAKDLPSLEKRSRFLLALKFFELGELSSGQAAGMCGLSRVAFLFEAGRNGVPVADLPEEELTAEFA